MLKYLKTLCNFDEIINDDCDGKRYITLTNILIVKSYNYNKQ